VLRQTSEPSHGSRVIDGQPESLGDPASNRIRGSQVALGEPIKQRGLREVLAFQSAMV
jgi:hypothetical protein